jgi:hypothetical protein
VTLSFPEQQGFAQAYQKHLKILSHKGIEETLAFLAFLKDGYIPPLSHSESQAKRTSIRQAILRHPCSILTLA